MRDWLWSHRLRIVASVLLLGFVVLVFTNTFRILDRREETDAFLTRQVLVNDLDQIEHRIAEKERARCEEQFIKDVVKVIRTNPDPEATQRVQGCFGPEQATHLRDLYAKRDALALQLEEQTNP